MKFIILRIPPKTTKSDIKHFVSEASNRGFRFRLGTSPPRATSVNIIRITDSKGIVERHGIINLEPDKKAPRFAAKLNRSRLNGKLVSVRQYYSRSLHRRTGGRIERRRSNLRIELETYPVVVGVG